MLQPIARRTVADEVRDRLMEAIGSGAMPPGTQLPSERTLCEELGVARTSVREAIQALMSLGVLERRGNRTFVTEHLPEIDFDSVDVRKDRVRELFEVRRLVEIPMAELAACRATDEERERIAIIAAGFNESLPLAEFRALDRLFHASIARACRNPLLGELFSKILDALFASDAFDSLLSDDKNSAEVAEIIVESGKAHRRIAEAIVVGDAVAVAAAVSDHLDDVENDMLGRLQ